MTAYARHTAESQEGTVTWELRSVNNRYLDTNVRLPEELRALEPQVREQVSARLKRGKIDCNLRYQATSNQQGRLHLNHDFAARVAVACQQVDGLLGGRGQIDVVDVLRWPGVLNTQAPDTDTLNALALDSLAVALTDLIATREREGARLVQTVAARCDNIEAIKEKMSRRLPALVDNARARLRTRLQEVQAELEPARVEAEIVLFCQKMDVAEELDRLYIHVEEVRRVLEQKGAIGRRLDFLMQELNREANTLGSKSVDPETSAAAVDLKVLIEQMREQIQNLE